MDWRPALLAVGALTAACRAPEPRVDRSFPAPPTSAAPSLAAPVPSGSLAPTAGAATRPSIEAPLISGGKNVADSVWGMVSSVERNATLAGVAILERGGNAVDAAVAVGYALAVTHPSAGNVGGGGFLLFKRAGQPAIGVDFRERAPAALTLAGFDALIRKRGLDPRASGVPGTVAGLNHAHRKWGQLSLAEVMAPALELARSGHPLSERAATVLRWSWPQLERDRALSALFGRAGAPLRAGQILIQPALATLLERIARSGDDGFYRGATAQVIARYMQRHNGWISEEDLAAYRAVERPLLGTSYRNFDVEVMSPPSAGGVAVVQMLEMLEAEGAERLPPQSVEGWHLFLEVGKRAHAERRLAVGDPDTLDDFDWEASVGRWSRADTWLAPHPIDPKRATASAELDPLFAAAQRELDHTTHFSVIDPQGNAVSCTTTLSGGFGAKYAIGELGLVMNNSVAAFGTVGKNTPKPNRRMTSSMSPSVVSYAGQTVLVLGSPGGDTIPSTVVSVLRNLIDGQMDLQAATDAPRLHHGFVPDSVRSETSRPVPAAVQQGLQALGHRFGRPSLALGAVHAILLQGGVAYGYADPREGGLALGPRVEPALRPPTAATGPQPIERR